MLDVAFKARPIPMGRHSTISEEVYVLLETYLRTAIADRTAGLCHGASGCGHQNVVLSSLFDPSGHKQQQA